MKYIKLRAEGLDDQSAAFERHIHRELQGMIRYKCSFANLKELLIVKE